MFDGLRNISATDESIIPYTDVRKLIIAVIRIGLFTKLYCYLRFHILYSKYVWIHNLYSLYLRLYHIQCDLSDDLPRLQE